MGLGKTREANNVMGLSSPANGKQYNSTHILPQTNQALGSIHESKDPFHNLNVIMNKIDPYSNVNEKNSLVKQFINTESKNTTSLPALTPYDLRAAVVDIDSVGG